MVSQKRRIAEDLYSRCGALVSLSDMSRHFGMSKETARRITKEVQPVGHSTGKRYFYEDVAEAILRY